MGRPERERCMRRQDISNDEMKKLKQLLDGVKAKGKDAWELRYNCSNFASDTWEQMTGEAISPAVPGLLGAAGLNTPAQLFKNIKKKNGGEPIGIKKKGK